MRKKYQNAKNPENLLQQKITIKTELEINALAAARGAQTRARVKFIEKGEQNRTHFLSLKKIKIPATTIASLKTDKDIAITNQADLLHEQERFYPNLYQENKALQNTSDTYIKDFLGHNSPLPTLTEPKQTLCAGTLHTNEVAQALKVMKNESAAGCNGITTAFDKVIWINIRSMPIDSCIISHDKRQVSRTQQRGIISLIHRGKDLPRDKRTNWRPVTLLSRDYKILA